MRRLTVSAATDDKKSEARGVDRNSDQRTRKGRARAQARASVQQKERALKLIHALVTAAAAAFIVSPAGAADISGAGATFPDLR